MKHLRFIAAILIITLAFGNATADDKDKYRQLAEQVRQEVWANDLPAFHQRTCPEQYKTAHSAVILAAYYELVVDQHRKTNVAELLLFGRSAKIVTANSYMRRLVAINDELAREAFSQFDFATVQKGWERGWRQKRQTVVGLRIIKPSGEVREVPIDDYVSVDEGRGNGQQRLKVAVPDLQAGDLLDYFIYNVDDLEENSVSPYHFSFIASVPMLSYQVHCVIDRDMTTQYRTLNGAPDFRQGTDADGNVVLDVEVSNVEQTEPRLWYDSTAQTPTILLCITGKKLKGQWAPPSTRQPGLQANPHFSQIVADDVECRNNSKGTSLWGKELKQWKQYCERVADMQLTPRERVARLYTGLHYLLRFSQTGQLTTEAFLNMLREALEKQGFTVRDLYTTHAGQEPIDQLISYRNTMWGLYLDNPDCVLLPPFGDTSPFIIPSTFQGRAAILDNADGTIITLPASKPGDNCTDITLTAEVADGTTLRISRRNSMGGIERERLSTDLYTISQLFTDVFGYLGINLTMADVVGKKYLNDLIESNRQQQEQKEQLFRLEASAFHDTNITELESYRVEDIGFRHDSTALVYSSTYTLDGLLKRAGGNLVLSIGRLLSQQMKVEDSDRQRTTDIHFDLPASESHYDITFRLPEGYVADSASLNQLNTEVQNSCGAFIAHATTNGSELKLTAIKRYCHAREPLERWPEVLEFIDAASAFNAAQVVLRPRRPSH